MVLVLRICTVAMGCFLALGELTADRLRERLKEDAGHKQ